MIILFSVLLLFIIISRLVETHTKIPTTLTLILLSFSFTSLTPEFLNISNKEFDEILYLMLPVILLPDVLNISTKELKEYYKEIFYLAFVAVIISISIAVFIAPFLLPQYQFTVGMLIALFAMLMATDAITVTSIMNKFKLPKKLKIFAETESLFNDVTALVIFYFIAFPLITDGQLNILDVNITLVKVLLLSTGIGVIIAYIGYLTIKLLKNTFDQFLVIYLIVIISFITAEHFEIAGILSIVASVLAFKYFVKKELKKTQQVNTEKIDENEDIESTLTRLIKQIPALTKKEFREYKKEAEFIGIFANAIVFTILANIIDLQLLLNYTYEILIVFLITSIIRFSMVGVAFQFLKLPFRWTKALTLAGTKGALAIIMVHSLPDSFLYREMFEAVIVGNVLLSTFVYTFLLMFHINNNQDQYKQDMLKANEKNHTISTKNLIEVLGKDPDTGAFTKEMTEEIIEKELKRTQRYKTDFSLILIKFSLKEESNINILTDVGSIIKSHIRVNDSYGKVSKNSIVILTTNTSLSGAMVLAEKLKNDFEHQTNITNNSDFFIGITAATDVDTLDSILEKLHDAIFKVKMNHNKDKIEIEI